MGRAQQPVQEPSDEGLFMGFAPLELFRIDELEHCAMLMYTFNLIHQRS
jgi:hypothetical protein